jgi:hypothetical protein
MLRSLRSSETPWISETCQQRSLKLDDVEVKSCDVVFDG